MAFKLVEAKRSQAKLKMAFSGPSGSGKTMSALLAAYGFLRSQYPKASDADLWHKVALIDTENGSGSLYRGKTVGNTTIGTYYTIPFPPPFSAKNYMDAISAAEEGGIEFLIIDSFSHAWSGVGGALDRQGKIADRTGNSYTAWRDVTPEHNALVDKILQCPMHVIATMRAKTEYVQEKNDKGKTVVRKVGTAPIMRDGVEYEFTCCFDINDKHVAYASKDRTSLFDGDDFVITPDIGRRLYAWYADADEPEPVRPAPALTQTPAPVEETGTAESTDDGYTAEQLMAMVDDAIRKVSASGMDREVLGEEIKAIAGVKNYKKVDDPVILMKLYDHFNQE